MNALELKMWQSRLLKKDIHNLFKMWHSFSEKIKSNL